MKYSYRKGTILTITGKNGGQICKTLARPGQEVYHPITEEPYLLDEGEYVVYYNELGIDKADYIATLHHGMLPLFPGILVHEEYLKPSTEYEKRLRRKGITKSPYYYNSEEPEGLQNEIIAFKYFGKPRILKITKVIDNVVPLFELSNGDVIERGALKLFYRKATEYEKEMFFQQNKTHPQNIKRVLAFC